MTKTRKFSFKHKISGLNCKQCGCYYPRTRRLGFCICIASDDDFEFKSSLINGKKLILKQIKNESIEKLRMIYQSRNLDPQKEKLQNYSTYQPTLREKKEFYQSWQWKELRYNALKKYGAKCMLCRSGDSQARLSVDHIKPISKFWDKRFDTDNLQILCDDCNKGKSNKDYSDFRGTK